MRRHHLLGVVVAALLLAAPATWARGPYGPGNPGPAQAHPPQATFSVKRDIAYVENSRGNEQKLDIYLPTPEIEGVHEEVPKTSTKYPVVVWIHGGGWSAGSKNQGTPIMHILHNGLAVVAINYRLAPSATFPAQLYDCKAAIRWIRAHGAEYGLKTDKIAVWGGSAGGHLAALVGTTNGRKDMEGDEGNLDQSSAVQAVCDWFGPTDLSVFLSGSTTPPYPINPKSKEIVERFLGDKPDLAKAASPVTYASKKAPPFLIMQGDKDPLVPWQQSEELEKALQKKGAKVTYKLIQGAGHGEGFTHNDYEDAVAFLKEKID